MQHMAGSRDSVRGTEGTIQAERNYSGRNMMPLALWSEQTLELTTWVLLPALPLPSCVTSGK